MSPEKRKRAHFSVGRKEKHLSESEKGSFELSPLAVCTLFDSLSYLSVHLLPLLVLLWDVL